MADPTTAGGTEGLYVLIKRGLYYRPQAMGYTGVLSEAGRYTERDARAHAENGVTMQLASEADEFSPQCWPETQIKMLRAAIARASAEQARVEAERDGLKAAIQAFLDGNYDHPRRYRPGKCGSSSFRVDPASERSGIQIGRQG